MDPVMYGPRHRRPLGTWSLAEASSTAALLGMVVLWARLLMMIGTGTVRDEPFLGSPAWVLGLLAPPALFVAVWALAVTRRRKAFTQRMNALASNEPLAGWNRRIREMDRLLRPFAERPVDIDRPGWLERLAEGADPLDETGLRADVEGLVLEVVDRYEALSDDARDRLRELWRAYDAFAWAASLGIPPTTLQNLRRHLILFSIRDQGPDTRDELVSLGDLCDAGRQAGIDPRPLLREVAGLSSDAGRGTMMGSTRAILLSRAE